MRRHDLDRQGIAFNLLDNIPKAEYATDVFSLAFI